ncbi:hypothetical protein [Aquimarina sp. 2304DJ70-9]|uniref:hypothetical protein n=1 Tax=Aquimarina penaris TaxID=3231044 RepID=UPI003462C480
MNKFICSMALLCCIAMGFSQEGTGFDYSKELQRIASIPNSPEAEAFTKYGNTPVRLYTGATDTSIPIYTHQGKEMSLPITLTYDASGIRVDQMATQVGLGWNLNVGGRISRNVNGLPDDFYEVAGNYQTLYNPAIRAKALHYMQHVNTIAFDTEQEVHDYFLFIEDISKNLIDTQSDYYRLNAMGLNEMIALDIHDNLTPKTVNNPRIKVQKTHGANNSVNSWVVTGEDGAKYFFEVAESTIMRADPVDQGSTGSIINKHHSSWVLTRIESPNKKDVYEFEYTTFGFWIQEPVGYHATFAVNEIKPNQTNYPNPEKISGGSLPYSIKQQFLTRIKYNNDVIVSNTLGDRADTDGRSKKLDNIKITDYLGNQIQKVDFEYTYFGDVASTNVFDKRLKLDKLTFRGKSTTSTANQYAFEYNSPEEIPSRLSLAQDAYGYFNGALGNTVLYPSYIHDDNNFGGANRRPNFSYAQIGLLNKITYPTKGYTTFTYEGHKADTHVLQDDTETFLNTIIYPNDAVDESMFRRADGNICDDVFLETGFPKAKVIMFMIPESSSNGYTIKGTNILSASIAKLGNLDQAIIQGPLYGFSGEDTYKTYCDFISQPNHWTKSEANFTENIVLQPGIYKALVLSDADQTATSQLWMYRETSTLVRRTVPIGAGARIYSIKDFSAEGKLAGTRIFGYTDDDNRSTSIVQYRPVFSQVKTVKTYKSLEEYGKEVSQLHRNATSPNSSSGPAVTYASVKEYKVDNEGNANGYTKYTFNPKREGVITRNGYPYQRDFYGGTISGSTSNEMVISKTNDTLLEKSTDNYLRKENFLNRNLVVYTKSDLVQHRVGVEYNEGDGKYRYGRMEPSFCNLFNTPTSPTQGTSMCADQTELESSIYAFVLYNNYAQLELTNVVVSGEITAPTVETTIEKFDGEEVVKTTNYTYDPAVDYLLREVVTQQSNGQSQKTKFFYPKDSGSAINNNLIAANRLGEVIKTEQYKNGKKLATKQTIYTSLAGNKILPKKIQTYKGALPAGSGLTEEPYEDRMIIHRYDTQGNPLEVSQAKGSHTIYIWGYKNQIPIARISNATYTDMPVAVSDLINQIKTVSNTENSKTQEAEMHTLFDALRTHSFFTNSEMNCYTYDPGIGATSMTDARGYTMYYQYDDLNRLIEVKDQDQHLLSKNTYHYKDQN